MKQNSLAVVVIAGLVGFLWPLAHWMQKIDTWENAWNPPGVGEFIICICFGLVAIAAALGMDIKKFLAGMGICIGTPDTPAAKDVDSRPAGMGGFARVPVLVVTLALCVTLVGCATINKWFDRPPRDVASDLLIAMEWSVAEAQSVEWLSADDGAKFTRIDHTVRDIFAANDTDPKAFAVTTIKAFITNDLPPDSRIIPWLWAIIVALGGTVTPALP